MAIPKPTQKKEGRSLQVPLLIAAGVLVLIGVIMLVTNKVQSSDPTLTAAPPTGTPGQQIYHASAGKMAFQDQVMAKRKAEMDAFLSAAKTGSNRSGTASGQSSNGYPGTPSSGPGTYVGGPNTATPVPAATH